MYNYQLYVLTGSCGRVVEHSNKFGMPAPRAVGLNPTNAEIYFGERRRRARGPAYLPTRRLSGDTPRVVVCMEK